MGNIFIDIVEYFGGQVATAKSLGVTQGTVSGWVRGIHGCSAEIALLIQDRTSGRFSATTIRPSLASALPTVKQTIPGAAVNRESDDDAVIPSSTNRGAA